MTIKKIKIIILIMVEKRSSLYLLCNIKERKLPIYLLRPSYFLSTNIFLQQSSYISIHFSTVWLYLEREQNYLCKVRIQSCPFTCEVLECYCHSWWPALLTIFHTETGNKIIVVNYFHFFPLIDPGFVKRMKNQTPYVNTQLKKSSKE